VCFYCSSDPVVCVPLKFPDNLLNDRNSSSLQPNEVALNDLTFENVKHKYVISLNNNKLVLCPPRLFNYKLYSSSAVTLLVGDRKGVWAVQNVTPAIPKGSCLADLWRHDLTLNIHWKSASLTTRTQQSPLSEAFRLNQTFSFLQTDL